MKKRENFLQTGLSVIEIEAEAVAMLKQRLDESFIQACEILFHCPERIVVMGMGKSSYVGGKIASTLASTGSPAFFVHPGEASHGDLGMITAKDVVIAVSNSGETPEILTLLPLMTHLRVPLVVLTGNIYSTLAKAATVCLDVSVKKEACPLGLAPTSSTTAALVMGDALAVALLEFRGFTATDFARSHPGGRLGKKLLLTVKDLMRVGQELPKVLETVTVDEALTEMSQKTFGMTIVVNTQNKLVGIYTDGDLRRTLGKGLDIRHIQIREVMTLTPGLIKEDKLAVEALQIMEEKKITALIIVNIEQEPIGVIRLHDLLQAGVA